MSPSATARATSQRGLLAGLLALVLFASSAVAMTAHGASAPTGGAVAAQPVVVGAAASSFDDEGRRGDEPRRGR